MSSARQRERNPLFDETRVYRYCTSAQRGSTEDTHLFTRDCESLRAKLHLPLFLPTAAAAADRCLSHSVRLRVRARALCSTRLKRNDRSEFNRENIFFRKEPFFANLTTGTTDYRENSWILHFALQRRGDFERSSSGSITTATRIKRERREQIRKR